MKTFLLCCGPLVILALGRLSLAADAPFNRGRWIDLSHDFSTETIYWPTEPNFDLKQQSHGKTAAGYFYAANRFCTAEHGGTHMDAPIHFAEGRATVDQVPLSQLTGPAIILDVSKNALANADYQITVGDFEAWEKIHGRIPVSAIVLLKTGYSLHWPDPKKYLGTEEKGPAAIAKLHFPGLHPEAARWLLAQRSIKAVGLDTASVDYGQSTLFETHRILFDKNIPAFENVAGLEQLPPTGAYVVALPMKIK